MKKKLTFPDFLERFPIIELPIILGENTHHEFSRNNQPLSNEMIHRFIDPIEGSSNEFTEYVAGFRVPKTDDFYAIVYWKADLMNYQYIITTFDKKGELIDRAVIAGIYMQDGIMTQSVATLEPDWTIYIVSGQLKTNTPNYDPSSSRVFELELLPDGKIIWEE